MGPPMSNRYRAGGGGRGSRIKATEVVTRGRTIPEKALRPNRTLTRWQDRAKYNKKIAIVLVTHEHRCKGPIFIRLPSGDETASHDAIIACPTGLAVKFYVKLKKIPARPPGVKPDPVVQDVDNAFGGPLDNAIPIASVLLSEGFPDRPLEAANIYIRLSHYYLRFGLERPVDRLGRLVRSYPGTKFPRKDFRKDARPCIEQIKRHIDGVDYILRLLTRNVCKGLIVRAQHGLEFLGLDYVPPEIVAKRLKCVRMALMEAGRILNPLNVRSFREAEDSIDRALELLLEVAEVVEDKNLVRAVRCRLQQPKRRHMMPLPI
mgnify:CR=1 FL=1